MKRPTVRSKITKPENVPSTFISSVAHLMIAIEKPLKAPVMAQIKIKHIFVHGLKAAVSGEIWFNIYLSQL